MEKELGIYVHIPFCIRKCQYCDFISYTGKEGKIQEYCNMLIKEIEQQAKEIEDYQVTTIYLGGGTPSFIESKEIDKILEAIHKMYRIDERAEITIEINPGAVQKEKLKQYKNIGIHRLSIGLQETQDEILQQIGRIHTYKEFLNTYQLARQIGFENINVDLMIGLPNQTLKIVEESLDKILSLNPEHICVYSLIVEENTPLAKEIEKGKYILPAQEQERAMYWLVKDTLQKNGYNHDEISNFAKPNKESRHNVNCWKQKEYLGFGVAAHSYLKQVRYSNTENLEEYIQNIRKNKMEENRTIQEVQTKQMQMQEYMLLGLRKLEGIAILEFREKFQEDPIKIYAKELKKLEQQKLISINREKIKLTNRGLDLANWVWEEFI